MIFKILLSAVIVLGSSYLGYMVSERQKDRLRQLSAFSNGLTMLEFNISHMNYPIGKALERASGNCEGVVKKIFFETGKMIRDDFGRNPGEILIEKIDENQSLLCISPNEIEILKSFSKTLSEGDVKTEITNIQAARIRLNAAFTDATDEVNRKAKATKKISVLAGIFVVILLL